MSGEANQVKWRGVQPVAGIRGVWPSIDAVRVVTGQYRTTAGTSIIYTPAAGKILFVSSVSMTTLNKVVQASQHNIRVRNVADVDQFYVMYHYMWLQESINQSQPFMPAIEVPAGYDVIMYQSAADMYCRSFIFGWLEDA